MKFESVRFSKLIVCYEELPPQDPTPGANLTRRVSRLCFPVDRLF